MKKIGFSLLAMLFAINVSIAQWNSNGNYIYYNSGNVGIGTTTARSALDIWGGSLYVTGNDINGTAIVTASQGSAYFCNNTLGNGITVTPNGNIGIGSTSPVGKLQVAGPLDGSIANLEIGDPSPGNTNVPVGSPTGGYNIDFHTWRDVLNNQIGARIRAERINNFAPYSALVQSMDLAFYTSDGWNVPDLTERLRIKSTGNIGIGTKNPDQLLTVNGTIHAKQVNVDVNIVPDYVFNKGYKLRSLIEVSRYIALNNHLPEIPSAKTMEKTGVNVTELNMALLKKVEELTLYLIDKDKQIKELQGQVDGLKRNAADKDETRAELELLKKQVSQLTQLIGKRK